MQCLDWQEKARLAVVSAPCEQLVAFTEFNYGSNGDWICSLSQSSDSFFSFAVPDRLAAYRIWKRWSRSCSSVADMPEFLFRKQLQVRNFKSSSPQVLQLPQPATRFRSLQLLAAIAQS